MGLTFAKYVIQPFFPGCPIPIEAVRIFATLTICKYLFSIYLCMINRLGVDYIVCLLGFLTYLNSTDIKGTTKMQNVFMFCKIGALIVVILAGVVWMCMGNVGNFENSFEGTTSNPGKIAKAFYSGIFSYSGWNYLNFMTEELKNPYVNLPRAIYISLPIVTSIYVLANMAYLAVLTPTEMMASDAIAVTFANHLFGSFAWIVPVMVAISAFGGLSVHIMTSSRMLFVGARNNHFPTFLAHLDVKHLTPLPSLVFLVRFSLLTNKFK